jgi:hypothetical protein
MIFIWATLLRVVRVHKTVVCAERFINLCVVSKLFAVIKRDRVEMLLLWLDQRIVTLR